MQQYYKSGISEEFSTGLFLFPLKSVNWHLRSLFLKVQLIQYRLIFKFIVWFALCFSQQTVLLVEVWAYIVQ